MEEEVVVVARSMRLPESARDASRRERRIPGGGDDLRRHEPAA